MNRWLPRGCRFDFHAEKRFIRGMTGFAKGFCMLVFIALAMMQPAGHWYCTITNTLCSMDDVERCSVSNLVPNCCENHSEEKESPCCIEIEGEWQVVPSPSLVSLPEPSLLDPFALGEVNAFIFTHQTSASSWNRGGIDPPPRKDAARALFCVRLI